jgi:type IX secretion system PorP/SprF family membrane protein
MKKIFKYIYFNFLFLTTNGLFAQQEVGLAFASNHMNIINPAFVSVSEEAFVRSSLRKQWSAIAFSPETQVLSFGTSLGNNLSMGLSVVNDKTFVEKETFVGVDLSYKLQLDRYSQLHFGIKTGGVNYSVNLAGIETYNMSADPNLYSLSTFYPNFGLGMVYTRDDFYVSFSVPRLLNSSRARNDEGFVALFTDTPHFYLGSGYSFILDDIKELTLKPSLLLRHVKGAPLSFDLNAMIDFNKKFEFGFMYRAAINSTSVFATKAIITISKQFNIGYGYEFGTAQLASAWNSNELFLQFRF